MRKEILLNSEIINSRAMEFDVLGNNQKTTTTIIRDLQDTLEVEPDRLYLCANEIGYTERMFAIKFTDEIEYYCNPVFQDRLNLKLVREYDPLTKKEYIIPRYTDVTLCYQDTIGKIKASKFTEQASIIVCQAMNCLDGIHTADYGLEMTPEFDLATEEEKNELLFEYIKSLNALNDALDNDLISNEDTRERWNAFKFITAQANGEIETDVPKEPKMNRKQRRFFERLAKKLRRKN